MKGLPRFALVALTLALWPAAATAQQGATVTGQVTAESGGPLPAVSVFIEALSVGSTTDENGRYTFSIPGARVNGQTVRITARRIGYTVRTATITVTPGEIRQNFVLGANPLRLGDVVVTGAGTSTEVQKLGNVRNEVDSTSIQKSNESNIVNALAAKAPNVEVTSQSGEAGASSAIRMRGERTVNGTGQPLFIVDGQPIDNTTIATGDPTASTAAPNRASDINPADIESIEILKGAAAAAIYGARAGQGVVLITTKSGRPGGTRYSLRSTSSADEVNTDYPIQHEYGQGSGGSAPTCSGPGCRLTSLSWGPKLPAGTKTYDHFKELFRTGSTFDNVLSASGGNDRTLFYISGERLDQKGIIVGPNNWYKRSSVRLKASHRLTDRFNVGGNVAYVDSRGSFIQKGSNISGLLLGGLRTPPDFNNKPYQVNLVSASGDTVHGIHRSYRYPNPTITSKSTPVTRGYDNPLFVANEFENTGDVGRAFGNVSLDYDALDWLSAHYKLGADYYADERLEGFPLTASNSPTGLVNRADFTNLQIDHNLLVTASKTFSDALAGTLTLGQNLNSRRFRQLYATGTELIAEKPFQLDNTIQSNLQSNEYESLVHNQAYFAQLTTDLWNQLFLTGAIRNDGSSTFGKSKPRHWFPKGSIAWNFTDRVPFRGVIPSGKLRAAYGEAGQEPPVYSTLSGLVSQNFVDGWISNGLSTTQAGIGGLATSSIRPQPNLGPEVSKEFETGIDLGLFRNYSDLSFTYYNSKTVDVILFTPQAPSTGYLQQASNAGTITNKGVEVVLNIRPVTTSSFSWDVGLQYAKNNNKVVDLKGISAVDLPTGGYFTGAVGAAVAGSHNGVLRGFDFARCGYGLVLGDGTNVDSECGSAPRGALYLAADGFPRVDETTRIIADGNPDWTGSVRTNVTVFSRVHLSALLDIKRGGQIWNGTKGALTNFGTHTATLNRDQTVQFGKNYMPAHPGASGPVGGPGVGVPVVLDQGWYQGDGSGFGSVSAQFVEDGSYSKLREVSIAYTIDNPGLLRGAGLSSIDLRLAGRNLYTWTKYSGIDPETNLGGAEVAIRGVDYFNNPQSRSFVFSVALNR
jgi:TonB-linked SusC/RagA family outer membrane protein